MIVSKTDDIPTKKIVTVLGKISIKIIEDFFGSEENATMQKLIRKAKAMGADAITNFSYRRLGIFEIITTYSGLAVITEDYTHPASTKYKRMLELWYSDRKKPTLL